MSPPLARIAVWLTKLLGGGKTAFVAASRLAAIWQSVPKEQRQRLESWARTTTTKKTAPAKADWAVSMAESLPEQATTPARAEEAAAFLARAKSYKVAVDLASGLPLKERRVRHRDLKQRIDALVIEMFSWTVDQTERELPPAPGEG